MSELLVILALVVVGGGLYLFKKSKGKDSAGKPGAGGIPKDPGDTQQK